MSRPPSARLAKMSQRPRSGQHNIDLNPFPKIPNIENVNGRQGTSQVKGSAKLQSPSGELLKSQEPSSGLRSLAMSPNEYIPRILHGDVNAVHMFGKEKVIRLFVSSTFTDTKAERNYLMREVFPIIRKYCAEHGVEFGIVDLRWGIRDTATNDHMTTEICISEINKCILSTITEAPCFMYLAFNRYGSPPLPRLLLSSEMDEMLPFIQDPGVAELIKRWYRRDDNACPAVYTLQPISTQFPDFLTTTDSGRRRDLRDEWYAMSDRMLSGLSSAANKANFTEDQKLKWIISTTDNEVRNGLLNQENSAIHGLCYTRDIMQFEGLSDIPDSFGDKVWRYIDLDESGKKVATDVVQRLSNLREKVKTCGVKVEGFKVDWSPCGIEEATHEEHMKKMGDTVHRDLMAKITEAIDNLPVFDSCTSEIISNVTFCHKKSSSFFGREDLVNRILEYYEKEDGKPQRRGAKAETRFLFVLNGISGSGKTSLMAKMVQESQEKIARSGRQAVVVTRFGGTSPDTSSSRRLLRSMSEQIMRAYSNNPVDPISNIPEQYDALKLFFQESLSYATAEKPLILHIDSLDQLSDEDNGRTQLNWLPLKGLPDYVFLTVSTLPVTGGCLDALTSAYIPQQNFCEVTSLSMQDSSAILKGWLQINGRTLTEPQFDYVLKVALDESQEAPTTLRLRLLFDIAVKWTSYTEPPVLPPSVRDIINLIFTDMEKEHGKLLMSDICGLLGVSRYGLSENDLIDILSCDTDLLDSVLQYHKPPTPRLPYHVFARIINALSDYVVQRGAHGKSVLNWYHRQFWEAAQAKYLNSKEDIEKYAKFLLIYFNEEAHNEFPDRGLSSQPLYWSSGQGQGQHRLNLARLSEIPHALAKCSSELKPKYEDYLCNFQFIAAKCSCGLSRELAEDYNIAMSLWKNDRLIEYGNFFLENVHILEREPTVILQLVRNMSHSPVKLGTDADNTTLQEILPWEGTMLPTTEVTLINNSKGKNPCLLTAQCSNLHEYITGITAIDLAETSVIVVSSNARIRSKDIITYKAKLDIYNKQTGHFMHTILRDYAAFDMHLFRIADNSLALLHTSIDWILRVVIIKVDELVTHQDGWEIAVSHHTWTYEMFRLNDEAWRTVPGTVAKFSVSHDQKLIVTGARCIVAKKRKIYGPQKKERNQQRSYYDSVMKIWDFAACHKEWTLSNTSENIKPIIELDTLPAIPMTPVLEEFFPDVPCSTDGYALVAVSFSPDDQFIAAILHAECDGDSYSPHLTIYNSHDLKIYWTLPFVMSGVAYSCSDMSYWLTTYRVPESDIWTVAVSSKRAVSGIIIDSKSLTNNKGKRHWAAWAYKSLGRVHDIKAFSYGDEIAIVGYPSVMAKTNIMKLWTAPQPDLSDQSTWKNVTRYNYQYNMTVPQGLCSWDEPMDLSDLGNTISQMFVTDDGLCYTLSVDSEIKVTNLHHYREYIKPVLHKQASTCCALTPDKTMVVTGCVNGELGLWDSKTGDQLCIADPLTRKNDISTIGFSLDGSVIILKQHSNTINYFRTNQFLELIEAPKKKLSDIHDWCIDLNWIAKGKYIKELADDLVISSDRAWLVFPAPSGNDLGLMISEVGKSHKDSKKLVVHPPRVDRPLFGNYRGRFSPDRKYLLAFGYIRVGLVKSKGNLEKEFHPPLLKLFEKRSDGEYQDIKIFHLTPLPPETYNHLPIPQAIVNLAYVDNQTVVCATHGGKLQVFTIPDLCMTYELSAHTDDITYLRGVDDHPNYLITSSRDHWMKVFKYENGQLKKLAQYHNQALPTGVCGFFDGATLYVYMTDKSGRLNIFSVKNIN